ALHTRRTMLATPVRSQPVEVRPSLQPVHWWAGAGACIVAATAAMTLGWVSGPSFARVPQGPDSPPLWMRLVLMSGQLILPAVMVVVLYRLVVRPWRAGRPVPYDGLVAVGAAIMSFWDPFSNAIQPWFSYNSYLVSFGMPMSGFPGWLPPDRAGQTMAWPLYLPALYAVVFPLAGIVGCAVLRRARRAWPSLPTPLLLVVCAVAMAGFEIVFEGVVFMPLGFWSYGGGAWPVTFPGRYFQLPVNELLHATIALTFVAALRFFTDDKGLTFPERGANHAPPGRRQT